MSFRDNGDKEKVQAATDIVRLVGEQVNLRPKGKEFAGLCPFHDDKSPSMQVSPQKQIYKCFSCGAGGDCFSFVMNYHKMTFVEAMKYLAERGGVELTPWRPEAGGGQPSEGPSKRKRAAAANEQAVNFFKLLLKHPEHGKEARAYLERRGVSDEMIEVFGLGYAPDRWDGLVTMIREKGWDRQGFEIGSLIRPRKTGDGDFDFFRHRLIFPIFDAIGRPIAFGARKLRDEDEPKYLNSPETPLFHKSSTLYGLHAAKKAIIDTKTAVLVEGYTDVIACHQAGASNVVAALGTALTPEHVRELRRYCEQVVLVMDGDAAGQKAADRAIQVFLNGELDVAIAVIPGRQDPDELLKAGGLEAWQSVLDSARQGFDLLSDDYAAKLAEATSIKQEEKISHELIDRLLALGLGRSQTVTRNRIVSHLAGLLRLREAEIDSLLKERETIGPVRGGQTSRPPSESTRFGDSPADSERPGFDGGDENVLHPEVANGQNRHRLQSAGRAERRLIAALIRHHDLFSATLADGSAIDEAVSPADMLHPPHRRCYQVVYDRLAEGKEASLAGLIGSWAEAGDQEMIQLATTADAELDRALPDADADAPANELDDRAAVKGLLLDAAQAIVDFRSEQQATRLRQEVLQSGDLAAAERFLEARRSSRSPGRIARI